MILGLTWTDTLNRYTEQTHWTDTLNRHTEQTYWTDTLNRHTEQTHWTDTLNRHTELELYEKTDTADYRYQVQAASCGCKDKETWFCLAINSKHTSMLLQPLAETGNYMRARRLAQGPVRTMSMARLRPTAMMYTWSHLTITYASLYTPLFAVPHKHTMMHVPASLLHWHLLC